MPEDLYPQLPTAPSMSQESFNIEMVRKYYQDIANLNPIRPGGGRLRGPDGQTHSCQSETSYPMMPKLGDF